MGIWLWPVVLGVSTTSGLLSALVSDGWGDAWSWIALGLPVAVMAWFASPRSTKAPAAQLKTQTNELGSQR